ncbi:MAG TPA: ATP-binding protein [Candidatus Omnitrophota bacterium]|nr:ATP-binding protein [Candidatus Omnitrophota bacterium]HQQ06684.1 ATP-binding protein [Candidatus Omnitrophota bacterium]
MSERTKVLMIEDDKLLAKTLRDVLETVQGGFDVAWEPDLAQGLQYLAAKQVDVLLLDLVLPDSIGFETFTKVSLLNPTVPIIVMTGMDDETIAVNAVRNGAQDYLVKGQVEGAVLVKSIRYAIERKRIEEDLRKARTDLEFKVQERTEELCDINESLAQEVDERKKAEAQLQGAYEQLKLAQSQLVYTEKMETVGRLASGVAHEVKNPLAILLQCVEYLQRNVSKENEKVARTLEYMTTAVKRADNIIKGMLDFSSVSAIEYSRQRPEDIVENALVFVKHEIDKHHIAVEKAFAPDLPMISVDKNRIEHAFLNIFMNSIDAMADNGTLVIRVTSRVLDSVGEGVGRRGVDTFKIGDRVVVFDIEDNGCGIPGDVLDKIFDPFFTTKHDQGGTGLGLSIIKNIMDMHHGRISLKNREQGGVIATLVFRV